MIATCAVVTVYMYSTGPNKSHAPFLCYDRSIKIWLLVSFSFGIVAILQIRLTQKLLIVKYVIDVIVLPQFRPVFFLIVSKTFASLGML